MKNSRCVLGDETRVDRLCGRLCSRQA